MHRGCCPWNNYTSGDAIYLKLRTPLSFPQIQAYLHNRNVQSFTLLRNLPHRLVSYYLAGNVGNRKQVSCWELGALSRWGSRELPGNMLTITSRLLRNTWGSKMKRKVFFLDIVASLALNTDDTLRKEDSYHGPIYNRLKGTPTVVSN